MARYSFGGEITQTVATVGTGNALLLAPSAAVTFYGSESGGAVTDFLLWNSSTTAYDITATSVTTTAGGTLPRFQGPDGVSQLWAQDSGGAWLRLRAYDAVGSGTALTSYAAQVAALSDYPTAFPAVASGISDATAVGKSILRAADAAAARTAAGSAPAGDTAATPSTTVTRTTTGQVKAVDPVDDDDAATRGWVNDQLSSVGFTYDETMDSSPAGSLFAKVCVSGIWPARGSARTDIIVNWISRSATDPAPPVGGAYAIGDDYWQKVDA